MKIAIIHATYDYSQEKDHKTGYMQNALAHVQANFDKTFAFMHEAGKLGADIVITNEDFGDIGSQIRNITHNDCFASLVEQTQDSVTENLCSIAKKYNMLIAANEYESENGKVYNTSKLIGRDGNIIGKYKKVQLPSGEFFKVHPGAEQPVFKTDIGNIGFATCYDIIFPEHCRILALDGADIIIHQTQGWGVGSGCKVETGEAFMRVRAAENSVYLCVSKNIQNDGAMSCIVDNMGNIIASQPGDDDKLLIADIEPDFDITDPYDYDNYYAGLSSVKARHLLTRRPSAYKRITEDTPIFSSDILKTARLCTYEEWVERIKKLEQLDPGEYKKMHW